MPTNTIINRDITQNIHNIHDSRNWIKNIDGVHNTNVKGNIQGNSNIWLLQNLQEAKTQLQNLGANAVYIPENNSVVLLIWSLQSTSNVFKKWQRQLMWYYFQFP